VEDGYRALVAERDELHARVERAERRSEALERQLGEVRDQTDAVGRALVRAEELRVEAERDAEAIRSDARRQADEILAEASRKAENLAVDAEELMNSAKEHLTGLVQDLFDRAGTSRSRDDRADRADRTDRADTADGRREAVPPEPWGSARSSE
jgi:cell division septum initiation protein DivIVA